MACPLISIIIPIYNAEKTLSRCLDSLITQNYSNLEMILINDGSTDDSLSICNYYAKQDARLLIITTPNRGVSSARNEGLRQAKGAYIGFVDADDWIDPDMFNALYQGILSEETNCMAAVGVHARRWNDYLSSLCNQEQYCTISTEKCIGEVTKAYGLRGYLWNKLFKNIQLFLDEALVIGEDLEFVVRYLLKFSEASVTIVNQSLYHYDVLEIHDFTKLRYSFKKMYTKLSSLQVVIEQLQKQGEHKKAVSQLEAEICMTCFGLLQYWYSIENKDESLLPIKNDIQNKFHVYFAQGFKQADMVKRGKLVLLYVAPHLLVKLLHLKQKATLRGR